MAALFVVFGIGHLGFAAAAWLRRNQAPVAAVVITAVALALAYDNLVVGFGSTIGVSETLRTLSWGRFALHALVTPTLFVAAQRLGARVDDGPFGFSLRTAVIAALAGVAVSIATGLVGMDLVPETASGVVRYADANAVVPVASVAVVIVTGLVGWRLRRAGLTSALLAGSIVMFLGSAAPSNGAPVAGNLAEVVFVASLVRTLTLGGALVRTETLQPVGES